MSRCFICDKEISEKAEEHIIPSALGGRLTADILCKEHNSTFGDSLDADLIEALSFCTNILNPKRGRGGEHPDFIFNSEKGAIRRSATGKLSHKRIRPIIDEKGNSGITISIMGENASKEAEKEVSKYIENIGKKKGGMQRKSAVKLKKLKFVFQKILKPYNVQFYLLQWLWGVDYHG